jgi:hypothetical protein
MEKQNPASFHKNTIKILPIKNPEILKLTPKKTTKLFARKSSNSFIKKTSASLQKLPKVPPLYFKKESSSNLLCYPKFLNNESTLLQPQTNKTGAQGPNHIYNNRRHMIKKIDKIIDQCNDGFINNEAITSNINKTETEMKEIILGLSVSTDTVKKPRLRRGVKHTEVLMNRNSIKSLIKNMKITYIRTLAI